jgi:hypothetical protein
MSSEKITSEKVSPDAVLIDNLNKRIKEIIKRKNLNNDDKIFLMELIEANDPEYYEAKRVYFNLLKIKSIEYYRSKKSQISFFYDFKNVKNKEDFKLIDRLKTEIRQAVFVENQEWFDASYILDEKIHTSKTFKINFFTSEVKRNNGDKGDSSKADDRISRESLKDNFYLTARVYNKSLYHHIIVATTFFNDWKPKYYVFISI